MKHYNKLFMLLGAILLTGTFSSCKKQDEEVSISQPQYQVGQTINSDTLSGTLKGTMKSGKTYYLNGDVSVNKGDTLLMQNNVKLIVLNNSKLVIKGTFLSLGTEGNPNWLTVAPNKRSANGIIDPASDPAFEGQWGGIQCDTSCKLFVMKWTHVEYTGATVGTSPVFGQTQGDPSVAILFQNINGIFIMEDSWIYGTKDDGVRINSGKISIMRNTFEKGGYTGGDNINVKSGTLGDMAYNLFLGSCTNAFKISNSGGTPVECNVTVYNNTMVNGGFRQPEAAHGGSINVEKLASANIYNNLIVNCKYGLRIVNTADIANTHYGYTYNYGDSASVVNQFYPVGYVTAPKTTDYPVPSTYLPSGYTNGQAYTPTINLVNQNNPLFVGFTLPMTASNLQAVNFVGNANFHLQSNSPAVGKGSKAFTPQNTVSAVTDHNLAATITAPGSDIGAYQQDGSGNQH